MSEDQLEALKAWYQNRRPLYEGLSNIVKNTVESLIQKEGIDYLSVTSRAKTLDSLVEKAKKKSYKKPEEEITDFSGIRVITFIEPDVTRVCDLIKAAFNVHPSKSLDKANELGIDRFGYRSVHFICDLGKERGSLPEFSLYDGLLFEVQVRTVLQHAWAEIEHDRNYKFSGVLPTHIQRRLFLLAGVLEMVDREFTTLANDVDLYAKEVSDKARSGDLSIELNTTSLAQYIPEKIRVLKDKGMFFFDESVPEIVIAEMRNFGIETLADLDKLLNHKFLNAETQYQSHTSLSGFLRDAMMYDDIDRYFEHSWNRNWVETDDDSVKTLSEKYGKQKVVEILEGRDIEIDSW